MATFSFYNHTAHLFMSGAIAATDDFKVLLLDSNAVFDATDTTLVEATNSAVSDWEVSGSGWTAGGLSIANATIATGDTDDALLDGDDISQLITGGNLGPFSAYVIYDGTLTDDPPLGYITLTAASTVLVNNTAIIEWSAGGIMRINAPV